MRWFWKMVHRCQGWHPGFEWPEEFEAITTRFCGRCWQPEWRGVKAKDFYCYPASKPKGGG